MPVEMKVKKKENDKILKLSASKMKTYDSCQLKFYYNYIAKEKTQDWDHFMLGNLCHRTLEIFHEYYMKHGVGKHKSLAKLMGHSFSATRKEKEFKNAKHHILVEAKRLIGNYLKMVSESGMPIVKGVEAGFNIKLNDNVLVRGYIDRLDIMKNGLFHIVDYKTTKSVKYLEPFQLLVYGIWLQEEYKNVDQFKASYVLLRHNSSLKSYNFNTEDVEQCKKKILGYADQINNSVADNIFRPTPTPLCNWCDFNKICPTQAGW